MATLLYPAYPPPMDDRKIHSTWVKCFNIDGRLYGLDVSETGGIVTITSGAFISNGCVSVLSDSMTLSIADAPDEPIYIYGYFGYGETDNSGIIDFSKSILEGYAPIARKCDGNWISTEAINYEELRDMIELHDSDLNVHITSDQRDGFEAATEPHIGNVFATQSDNIYGPITTKGELAIAAYSMIGGLPIDAQLPYDNTSTILNDNFTTNYAPFLPQGVNDYANIANTTAKKAKDGYMEYPIGNILISSASNSGFSYGRCEAEISDLYDGIRSTKLRKFKIVKGAKSAHLIWRDESGTVFNTESNYIYSSIKIPEDDNIIYIEASVNDGTTTNTIRKEYIDLQPSEWNILPVNIFGLNKNTIKYYKVEIQYAYNEESSYFYIDDISASSYVETNDLTDIGDAIVAVRASSLAFYDTYYEPPKIDISIDGGSNYLTDILQNEVNLTTSLPAPAGNYKLRLRINLFNNGGNFNTTKISWPEERKNHMMSADIQSDIGIVVGGVHQSTHLESLLYRKSSDAMVSAPSNINVSIEGAGTAMTNRIMDINGGRTGSLVLTTHYGLNWANNSAISRQNLPERKYEHGCAADDNFRMMVWQGKFISDYNSAHEFLSMSDSWLTLSNSPHTGQSVGKIIGNSLYAARGTTTGSTGLLYNRNSKTWATLSLNHYKYYSTCAALKSNVIIYESQSGSDENQVYFDIDSQTEKNIQCPVTGPGTSDTAVYYDDSISFGPWESSGTYFTTHYIYTPYRSPRLGGFAVKYTV